MVGRRLALVPPAVLGVLLSVQASTACHGEEPAGETRIRLAEETYKRLQAVTVSQLIDPPAVPPADTIFVILDGAKAERFYLWSRRWMEAQRDNSTSREQRITAFKDHLSRLRALEEGELVKQLRKARGLRDTNLDEADAEMWAKSEFAISMKYFRLEAESWLSQAEKE